MVTDNEADRDELEAQLRAATEGMQRAAARLPQDAELRPHCAPLPRRGSPARSG
jgi:hypothetical protein